MGLSAQTRPENIRHVQERRGRSRRRVKLDGYSVRRRSIKEPRLKKRE